MSTLQSRFNPRANNFDLVRLIAALVVVYGHSYALAENKYDPLSTFLSYGLCGTLAVWSFLVISGFLIARSEEGSGLSAFLAARFLRIYPAFLIIVLIESFLIAPIFYEGPKSEYFQHWLTYHLHNALIWPQDPMVPNVFTKLPYPSINGSLWTIPLELSFYICLVVAAAVVLGRRYLFLLMFLASILGQVALEQLGISNSTPAAHVFNGVSVYNFVSYSSFFLAGVCAWKYRERVGMTLGGLVFALVVMLAARNSLLAPLAVKLCLPYIVLYIATCGSLGSRLSGTVGDLSYGTYLFAFPITNAIVAVSGQTVPGWAAFLLTVPLVLPLAWLSWRFVERPCLSLKRKARAPDRPAAASADG